MPENKDNLTAIISKIAPEMQLVEHNGQLSFTINAEHLIDVCNELKNNVSTKFDMLLDVTAIDYLSEKHLMEVVYFLYSNENKSRVRLKIQLNEKELSCQTVTSVWESANWYERETFDMYGVNFIGHPDLRRFYMPDDFTDPISGEVIHPLRKDFPLAGISDSLPLPPYPEKYGEIK